MKTAMKNASEVIIETNTSAMVFPLTISPQIQMKLAEETSRPSILFLKNFLNISPIVIEIIRMKRKLSIPQFPAICATAFCI